MPIGIAKSYSRDSIGNSFSHDHEDTSRSSVGIANDDAGTSFSPEEMSGSPTWEEDVCEEENSVSYPEVPTKIFAERRATSILGVQTAPEAYSAHCVK